jgi:hypothetical protein
MGASIESSRGGCPGRLPYPASEDSEASGEPPTANGPAFADGATLPALLGSTRDQRPLADARVRARLADVGSEIPPRDEQTPEALGALQKTEIPPALRGGAPPYVNTGNRCSVNGFESAPLPNGEDGP